MIIKLPIIIDNKVYYSLFKLIKTNNKLILSIMENINITESSFEYNILSNENNLNDKENNKNYFIKILLSNTVFGYEFINIPLPIEFNIINNYLISDYFFIINIFSNLKNKLDFFYNFNEIVYNKLKLKILNFDEYENLNDQILNYIYSRYSYIINNKKFNRDFWNLTNLIFCSVCFLLWNNYLLSETLISKKYKISKKIVQIKNFIKNMKYSINYSNKFTIIEHLNQINNNKLELYDIKIDNYYILELNKDKYIITKILKINSNMLSIENLNYEINFYKYNWYNYFPDNKISKIQIYYYLIKNIESWKIIINKLDSKINSIYIDNIINYFSNEQIVSNLSFFILHNNNNDSLKTTLDIIKSNSYTKEYFKNICKIHNNNYVQILQILFNNYTFPIKFNKKELDIVFDSILYISLLNLNNILIVNDYDNKMYLDNKLNVPNKLKTIYFNQLKIYHLLIKKNNNAIKYISDHIHFNIIKLVLFSNSMSNEIIYELISIEEIDKFRNILITNFIINDILNRLSWENINKNLNYIKILLQNKEYLLFFDKVNKNLFPDNFDNRIKNILIKPFDMYKYLRKETDFIKWTNFLGTICSDFYYKQISFCTNDFNILGKIIYNLVNVKQQIYDDKNYNKILVYGNKYPKLILDNSRINIKIKEYLNFIKCNFNLGILAKHLNINKDKFIEFKNDNDEIESLKNKIIILSKKYLKYKKKYINSLNKV